MTNTRDMDWRELLKEVDEEVVKEAYIEQEEVQNFLTTYNYFNEIDTYGVFMELDAIQHELGHFSELSNIDINDTVQELREQIKKALETYEILKNLLFYNYDNIEELRPLDVNLTKLKKIAIKNDDMYLKSILEKQFD